ncbi:DNA polymerase III subunit delta' [Magnetovirga frankeli]|uniref:DNA polymerase III subunit delta' n=1 Tax=Magnetovirga frankeli TaxID=947516 RepID=UPI0012939215|nr:DNA polymerase III subunit delta' [gamma proteobacterium SS-5]
MTDFLPWQQAQWRQLQQARGQGRIPHALLLSGPAMTGKRRFAQAFAEGLLCRTPTPEHLACGVCDNCQLVRAGTHSDLVFLEPEESGKQLKIGTIREFIGSEPLSTQGGGYKLCILDPADALNTAAANALLKTLEEPSPSSLLLLISSQPGRLPVTIRSRCQRLDFPLPQYQAALDWLAGQGSGDWPTLLAVAAGAPLKALQLAGEGVLERRSVILQQVLGLLEGRADPLQVAEQWSKADVPQLLDWLASLLLDLLRLRVDPALTTPFNPDMRQALVQLAPRRSERDWHELAQELIQLRKSITSQLNLQLQLERLSIGLAAAAAHTRGGR